MSGETDITVAAFSQRYSAAYAKLAPIEGGFVNDPADSGGATNHGVSLRFLVGEGKIDLNEDGIADFDLDMDGDIDVADIRKLSSADAKYLFQRCFWDRMACATFPAPIGEAMFDQGVNGGIAAARKLLQRAINALWRNGAILTVDGDIGPATSAALAVLLSDSRIGVAGLITAYRAAAADRYRAIVKADPSQQRFLAGWLKRAAQLGAV